MVGLLLLIALVGAWIVFLLPVVRARAWHRPVHTVQRYQMALRTLGHFRDQAPVWRSATGRWVLVPTTDAERRRKLRQTATRRRQGAAQILVLIAGTALFLALLGGGLWWLAQGLSDVLLGAYVVLLGRRALALRAPRALQAASAGPLVSPAGSPVAGLAQSTRSEKTSPAPRARPIEVLATRAGVTGATIRRATRVAVAATASGQPTGSARPAARLGQRPSSRPAAHPSIRPASHRPDSPARPRVSAPATGGR